MADDPPGEDDDAPPGVPDDVDLRVPETATDEEAAAIAAAVAAYLEEERVAASGARERSWDGRRWTFAGRLGHLTGRAGRVPAGAPPDGWTAAGRADRF